MIQNSVQNRQKVMAERSPEYFQEEQSRNIAASMVEVALARLNRDFGFTGTYTKKSVMGGTGKITINNNNPFGNVNMTIEGAYRLNQREIKTTIDVVAKRPAFSIYAYFTDKEKTPSGNNIYFGSGDILNGRLHTNGTIRIYGNPVFNGPVTSHNGVYMTRGSDPTFNGSSDFNAPQIELPTEATEPVELAKSSNGGIGQYDYPLYVTYNKNTPENNDGTVEVSRLTCAVYKNGKCEGYSFSNNGSQTFNLKDFNGVISSTKKVFVKGSVDGVTTVHSAEDVEIHGDLMYENRNFEDESELISDDRLGIVSDNDVIVDKNAHTDNGSQDITIDASITALSGSFRVENYDDEGSKGTINLVGGLIQRTRGPVGLVGGTGYSKNYNYDKRFEKNSTPGFPKIKRFEIESWRETTTRGSIQ